MADKIFASQTTDIDVNTINGKKIHANGTLQVDIAGVLDGANVITYYEEIAAAKAPIFPCSWYASDGEISNGADGGLQDINNRAIGFKIENAGALTNISLSFDVQ